MIFLHLDLPRKLFEMLKGNKRLDAYLQCIAKDIIYEYCNSKHKKCNKKIIQKDIMIVIK